MTKQKGFYNLIGVDLDRGAAAPLYQQLYASLRQAILEGRLRPGQRLPATRELAKGLSVSRSTVLLAFEHLLAEGYVEGRTGAGTFVCRILPEQFLHAREKQLSGRAEASGARLSQRGRALTRLPVGLRRERVNLRPFRPGVPGLREFPFETWNRLLSAEGRRLTFNDYGYGDPAGYRALREAVAVYLRQARAVRCEVEQVIITGGTQQALDLACRLLLDPGDAAWVEDPGYNGVKEALTAAGARPAPVPVDGEGLVVATGIRTCPDARLVYITPSHQYPLGVTMSLSRRLELLEWAVSQEAYILEDDYDSEYRYAGRPLSSLQGIDRQGRVLYLGTFSKVLFPGLRIGYLVVPPALADAFIAAKAFADRQNPILEQAALARFIGEGHFGRHLRRMRLLYEERQSTLIEAVGQYLPGRLVVNPADTGLHLIGWLAQEYDEQQVARGIQGRKLYAGPLSAYVLQYRKPPGLVLGYAPYTRQEIRRAVQVMAEVF